MANIQACVNALNSKRMSNLLGNAMTWDLATSKVLGSAVLSGSDARTVGTAGSDPTFPTRTRSDVGSSSGLRDK